MLIVEYNIEAGNFAVPHPLPFKVWEKLAVQCGFTRMELLMTRPSRFLREIYFAVSLSPGAISRVQTLNAKLDPIN